MLKDSLLYLAQNPRLKDFVTHNRVGRSAARRFVAGETLEEAIEATHALNQRGIQVALDLLGENVTDAQEALAATHDYIQALHLIRKANVDANISVKDAAKSSKSTMPRCRARSRLRPAPMPPYSRA